MSILKGRRVDGRSAVKRRIERDFEGDLVILLPEIGVATLGPDKI
jgi:hypothetical protein